MRRIVATLGGVLLAVAATAAAEPARTDGVAGVTDYAAMVSLLDELGRSPAVDVDVVGRSVEGRELLLVALAHPGREVRWRVLFFARQHGDEVAGTEALLALARAVAARPERLPPEVGVWLLPMVNPDGAELRKRRNGAGCDLNRDHLLLSQPETRALHEVARRVMPHVAVDCHEFARDSRDYAEKGWLEWPLVMMDGLNHPLFAAELVAAATRWVEEARPVLAAAGVNYTRYVVGGPPPDDELRHSTLDVDDARNGIGAYGGLSFIIESGVRRRAVDPDADLPARVDATVALLWRFILDDRHREEEIAAVEAARSRPLPAFLPTNALWANVGGKVADVPVIDVATGATRAVATLNLMADAVVKRGVPAPLAYAVPPANASLFAALLRRHGVAFEVVAASRQAVVERCTLLRVEDEFDDVYQRYEGRQIVRREPPATVELAGGTLLVSLAQPLAVKAALVLEPAQLYGLYGLEPFRAAVAAGGTLPVLRVIALD